MFRTLQCPVRTIDRLFVAYTRWLRAASSLCASTYENFIAAVMLDDLKLPLFEFVLQMQQHAYSLCMRVILYLRLFSYGLLR